jgi:BASS family bile acid:Na+ symporter
MQQIAIGALVIVMMTAIGLRTQTRDFADVLRHPMSLVLGVLVNVVAVPFIVVASTHALEFPPEVTVGLVLCAASPGGATGPLFASAAGGHLAVAVTAMIALSLLSVLTAPATITLALGMTTQIDASDLVLPMMGTLVAFQMLPLVLGMTLRRVRPQWSERVSRPADITANVLLLAVIVGLLAAKGQLLLDVGLVGIGASIAFVLLALGLGASITRHGPLRRSWAMVTGVRNISLALLISATYFPAALTDAAILAFGLFTMVVPLLVARLLARLDRP